MALTSLSRSGYDEEIRTHLVHAGVVEAVFGFQGSVLLNKNVPAAVLVLKSPSASAKPQDIYFLDVPVEETILREVSSEKTSSATKPFEDFYWTGSWPGVSARASLEEVRAQQYSLAPQAYISQQHPRRVNAKPLDKSIEQEEEEVQRAQKELKAALDRLRARRPAMNPKRT